MNLDPQNLSVACK